MNFKTWNGNPFFVRTGGVAMLAALLDATKTWSAAVKPPKIKLYSNNIAIGPSTVVGDLTECIFTGYAAATTALTAGLSANGTPVAVENAGAGDLFVAGAIGTADIAYGWYMVDNAGTSLICAEAFDLPFSFDETGDSLLLQPNLFIPTYGPLVNP
jgi:hypothetical protein